MALQLVNRPSEVKLMQMLAEIRSQSANWQAIHFHLSELLDEYKSEYQIKIAINLIHDLLKSYEGTIFLLTDYSIVVLCHRLETSLLDKLIFQLRYLYMDDPLAYNEVGQENPDFCMVYDLRHEWQSFHDVCSRRMNAVARRQGTQVRQGHVEHRIPAAERPERAIPQHIQPAEDKGALSASKLVSIERNLRVADLHTVIRRQPVCAVLPDMKVRRVFDELYINIAHLRRMMKTEVDFLSNRWLFKYMTHILDERMLELIQENPARYLDNPISLNLNIETLISSAFTKFDASIKPESKVSIVLEVPVIDIFADMNAYELARKEAQKRGYRVCLDGLSTASFTSINREKLGLDLLKVQWNADLQADLKSQKSNSLVEAVQATGTNRVILCRCDNKSAVEYGQELGISLFQGRYLDSILNPTSKIEN